MSLICMMKRTTMTMNLLTMQVFLHYSYLCLTVYCTFVISLVLC